MVSIVDKVKRKIIIAWLAFGVGVASFAFLFINCGLALSLQFSCCLGLLIWVCFRWWTNPVHPGKYGYISPHTIISIHSVIYFGIGNLPVLAFPDLLARTNYGARDYYLPIIVMVIVGLVVFDFIYRKMVVWLKVNESLQECVKYYSSQNIQRVIPLISIAWYMLCAGIFAYMSATYIMLPFNFVGVEGGVDNIFMQVGYSLLGTTWAMLNLSLFREGKKYSKLFYLILILSLLPIMFGYQNRRIVVYCLIVSVGIYSIYKQKISWFRISLVGSLLVLFSFIIMSSIKTIRSPSLKRYLTEEKDLFRRAELIVSSPGFLQLDPIKRIFQENITTRAYGLDYAASMMDANVNSGIPFMGGRHNLASAAQHIPRVFWSGKSTLGPEGLMTRHFELNYFDQLLTILASSYADGGFIGVILGFGLLGLLFPVATKLLFIRKDGIIIYIGGLVLLLSFENTLIGYLLLWIRWILIIMVINSILRSIYSLIQGRYRMVEGQI